MRPSPELLNAAAIGRYWNHPDYNLVMHRVIGEQRPHRPVDSVIAPHNLRYGLEQLISGSSSNHWDRQRRALASEMLNVPLAPADDDPIITTDRGAYKFNPTLVATEVLEPFAGSTLVGKIHKGVRVNDHPKARAAIFSQWIALQRFRGESSSSTQNTAIKRFFYFLGADHWDSLACQALIEGISQFEPNRLLKDIELPDISPRSDSPYYQRFGGNSELRRLLPILKMLRFLGMTLTNEASIDEATAEFSVLTDRRGRLFNLFFSSRGIGLMQLNCGRHNWDFTPVSLEDLTADLSLFKGPQNALTLGDINVYALDGVAYRFAPSGDGSLVLQEIDDAQKTEMPGGNDHDPVMELLIERQLGVLTDLVCGPAKWDPGYVKYKFPKMERRPDEAQWQYMNRLKQLVAFGLDLQDDYFYKYGAERSVHFEAIHSGRVRRELTILFMEKYGEVVTDERFSSALSSVLSKTDRVHRDRLAREAEETLRGGRLAPRYRAENPARALTEDRD